MIVSIWYRLEFFFLGTIFVYGLTILLIMAIPFITSQPGLLYIAFSDGDFSCQKSEIPGTAIGQDHCREQENKKSRTEEG